MGLTVIVRSGPDLNLILWYMYQNTEVPCRRSRWYPTKSL